MLHIAQRQAACLGRRNIDSLNRRIRPALDRNTLKEAGFPAPEAQHGYQEAQAARAQNTRNGYPAQPAPAQEASPARRSQPAPPPAPIPMPRLTNPLPRGQKTFVTSRGDGLRLRVGFGWNVTDGRCDADASAFLLGADGRVPDDSWFVFYSQPDSPDGSVHFRAAGGGDRETIDIDLSRLSPQITKIVFVLTINEALEQGLHFGMVKDAYLRLMDASGGREIMSYKLDDSRSEVTSLTLAELYLHKDQWKFNPVGNGMRVDLAGQCAIYGVEIE